MTNNLDALLAALYVKIDFEADLALRGAELLRPSFKCGKKRKGESLLKTVRQLIESVNDTKTGQPVTRSLIAYDH
ncbi:hypothetical protein ACKI1I_34085 [Streptomyces turgidiscabies]|uniref:Transposase n=1 Tax=Streptomyces turgidiscabies (strain Car8) TaxID=698760 RepID=L7EYE2_STRT8|nr:MULTISPECIES: hypothetical protein [Streptomyces]ELP63909.1 hypothetical protein STRTUCAR8_04675 [Streptomyces turgidiscabies Car8]MDX3498667.1 hypothetical protein [Streptomyces turgidiscabies]GAQ74908.1 hypothetical protein T45_06689 [Streptomyces turgidiscabies]